MAVQTANQQLLNDFLGVSGSSNLGTGSSAKAQSTALNAWNLANQLISPVVDGSGGTLPAALQKLTAVWQGPAATEFVRQLGNLTEFGGAVTSRIAGGSVNSAAIAASHGYSVSADASNWQFAVENIQSAYSFAASQHALVSKQFDDWGNQVSAAVNDMLGQSVNAMFPQSPQKTITVGNHQAQISGTDYAYQHSGGGRFSSTSASVSAVRVVTNDWKTVDGQTVKGANVPVSAKVDADWVRTALASGFDAEFGDLVSYVKQTYTSTKGQLPTLVDQSKLPTATAPTAAQIPTGGALPTGGKLPTGGGNLPTGGGALPHPGAGPFKTLPYTPPKPGQTTQPPPYTLPKTPPGSTSSLPGPAGHGTLPSGGSSLPSGHGGLPGGAGSLPSAGGSGLPEGGSNPLLGTQTAGFDPKQAPGFTTGLDVPGGPSAAGSSAFGGLGGSAVPLGGGLGPGGLGLGGPGGLGGGGLGGDPATDPTRAGASQIGPNGQALAASEQAAAEAGAAGAAGRMPMMPPMAPMGMNNNDSDRQRKSWLPEEEDLWGIGETAGLGPAVLGGEN